MAKRAAAGGESLELSLKMGLSAITISLGIITGTNVDKLLINSYIYIYLYCGAVSIIPYYKL